MSFFHQLNIIDWIDFLWIPVAVFVVKGTNKMFALMFVMLCIIFLRLQVELIDSTGFSTGLTGKIDTPPYIRGLITYSVCIALFLMLSCFSNRTHSYVYIAATISIFVFVFVLSLVIMAL